MNKLVIYYSIYKKDIPRWIRDIEIYDIEEHNENLNSFYGLTLKEDGED